jgi:hypothetical protein
MFVRRAGWQAGLVGLGCFIASPPDAKLRSRTMSVLASEARAGSMPDRVGAASDRPTAPDPKRRSQVDPSDRQIPRPLSWEKVDHSDSSDRILPP